MVLNFFLFRTCWFGLFHLANPRNNLSESPSEAETIWGSNIACPQLTFQFFQFLAVLIRLLLTGHEMASPFPINPCYAGMFPIIAMVFHTFSRKRLTAATYKFHSTGEQG